MERNALALNDEHCARMSLTKHNLQQNAQLPVAQGRCRAIDGAACTVNVAGDCWWVLNGVQEGKTRQSTGLVDKILASIASGFRPAESRHLRRGLPVEGVAVCPGPRLMLVLAPDSSDCRKPGSESPDVLIVSCVSGQNPRLGAAGQTSYRSLGSLEGKWVFGYGLPIMRESKFGFPV